MCEQCSAETVMFVGQFLPGFALVRASKDGNEMKQKDWGLVVCNDPSFIWSATPMKDPFYGLSVEQISEIPSEQYIKLSEEYEAATESFRVDLRTNPNEGYYLVAAAMSVGYDPINDGHLEGWLFNYLADRIESDPNVIVDVTVDDIHVSLDADCDGSNFRIRTSSKFINGEFNWVHVVLTDELMTSAIGKAKIKLNDAGFSLKE